MHSRTITTTHVRSSGGGHHTGAACVLHTGALCVPSGFLKLLQLICGIVTTILITYDYKYQSQRNGDSELFFILMSVYAMITTACIVISMLITLGITETLFRSNFEKIFHLITSILLVIAGSILLANETEYPTYGQRSEAHKRRIAAGAIMVINSVLYFLSFLMSVTRFGFCCY